MSDEKPKRDGAGRWPKGQSGNASGLSAARRKRLQAVNELFLADAEDLHTRLVGLTKCEDAKVALGAIGLALSYAVGRPAPARTSDEGIATLTEAKLAAESDLAVARARELDLTAEVEELRRQVQELLGTGAGARQ